jgi:uncharacterized damage-inducible protein DinB
MAAYFRLLARYNSGANASLYRACDGLRDAALRRHRGSFFGSILGTLNHLLVGDTIWMTRFEGGEASSTGLDTILFDDFAALATARLAMDTRIECFMDNATERFLAGTIRYANNQGLFEDPLSLLLPHFFNHQTHRRGQVHALLTQAGVSEPPVLDLHRVRKPNPQERPAPPSTGIIAPVM